MAQRLSRRTGKAILPGMVGKSAAPKSGAAPLRVAFCRLPTLLPGTVKIYAVRRGRLYRRMIGVVAIGNKLSQCIT
jgi:hypothetical protein